MIWTLQWFSEIKKTTSFFYLIRLVLNFLAFSAFQDLFISKPVADAKKMPVYMGEMYSRVDQVEFVEDSL